MSRRDDENTYRRDVEYNEWQRGLPEGCISDEHIDDGYDSGQSPESLVNQENQRRQGQCADEEDEQYQDEAEQWPREQEMDEAEDLQDDNDR